MRSFGSLVDVHWGKQCYDPWLLSNILEDIQATRSSDKHAPWHATSHQIHPETTGVHAVFGMLANMISYALCNISYMICIIAYTQRFSTSFSL